MAEVTAEVAKMVEEEIKTSLVEGKLACPLAFQIAKKCKVSPRDVGNAANRLRIKIANCQLGCFP